MSRINASRSGRHYGSAVSRIVCTASAIAAACALFASVATNGVGMANAQELITNGSFAGGLTGWTQASWAGGSLFGINANGPTSTAAASGDYAYAGGGAFNLLQQNITLTTGSAYRLSFLAGSKSGQGAAFGLLSLRQEALTNYNAASFDYRPSDAAFGSYTVDFIAGTGTIGVWLRNDGGTYEAYDNVSVTPIASVANAMNYSAASGISSITSALTGSGKVTSNAGTGGLTLSGANTYTGGTEVTGGTLYVTGTGTLGAASGNVTVTSGSSGEVVLDLRNQQIRTGTIAMVGQDARIIRGDVNNPGSIVNNGVAFQFGGGLLSVPVSGSAGMNVTGGGSITGSNSYAGPTTIAATTGWYGTNTFFVDNANALGSAAADLTISGGIVSLGGNTVTRSGNLTISGGRVHTGTLSKSSGDYDIQGGQIEAVLAGAAGLAKSGTGTATLSGSNTYTGPTTVSSGTLQIGSGGTAGLLGSGTVALASTGNIVFNRSDALTVNNTFTWSGTSTSGGYITHSGSGTLALQGNQSVRGLSTTAGAGAVTVSGGTLSLGNASGVRFQSKVSPAAGTTITVTSAVAPVAGEQSFLYVGGTAASGIASFGDASSLTYGAIVVNAGTLDIVGTLESDLKSKRLAFEGTSGATVIQLSGSLTSSLGTGASNIQWTSAAADGGFAARTSSATINIGGSGQALTYGQTNFLASGRTLYFGSPTADDVVTFQNPLDLAGAAQTINVVDNAGSAGDAAVLAGVLSNGGLTKTGAGRLSLAADNTYTGLTTISAGTLSIGSGGTSGSITGDIVNNASLIFNRSDALTYSGSIGGSGGLSKAGDGMLTLTGNSGYAGATAVDVGGLLVNGVHTGVGLVSVASGARIGGDGSLAGGLGLGVQAQFIFNPLATLDVAGVVTLDDSFSVGSLVKSDGSAIDWGSIADGTYTLINTTSTFNNISNFGAGNAADIGGGRTAYFQNGSLQLVVVPEPGAFALAGLGIAAAWALRRRRRASVAGQR